MLGTHSSQEAGHGRPDAGPVPTESAPQSDGVSQPLRGPFTRWPRATDAILATVAFLAAIFQGSFADPVNQQDFIVGLVDELSILAYVIVAVASASLYLRRSRPLGVLGVNFVASIAWAVIGISIEPLLSLLFSLYAVGRYAANQQWSRYAAVGVLALVAIMDLAAGTPVPGIGANLAVTFMAWYIGRRIRIRVEYLAILKERTAYLERERLAEARQAVADERARIARELHDVVAHRVSMMTVQAGAAKTVAADDPTGALKAMEAVEQAGRLALDELRHLLGVLRPDAAGAGLSPQPGVAEIPRLVDELGGAGLEVELAVGELPADLPARVDLSAYRIVQEALTNVLKHGGPGAHAEVRLYRDNGMVAIEVLDRGLGSTILPGSGQGILGMRERASLLGGSLDAGPRPGGGFRVAARLPIGTEQT